MRKLNKKTRKGVALGSWCLPLLLSCGGEGPGEEYGEASLAATTSTIYLVGGSEARGGYDFSTRTYTGVSAGDFYYSGGNLWANNPGQRGIVNVGRCASVDEVTSMPSSGYSRHGVRSLSGNCYVSLSHNDERDHIVFRVVGGITANTVLIQWKLLTSGLSGATLTAGDSFRGGYDFSANTYQGLSGGDFYFTEGAFWANNPGQRGLVDLGACASADATGPVPMSGYWTQNVTAVAGNCYVSRTHFEERNYVVFRVEELTATEATLTWKLVDACYGLTSTRQNIDCWLSRSPVASSLIWETREQTGLTSVSAWPEWTNAQRDDLRESFLHTSALLADPNTWDPDPLVDPPTNQEALADNVFPATVLSQGDAWRLYVKTVAMSLAVELQQYVPWTITTYDSTSLAALFDSRLMLKYTWPGMPPETVGWLVPKAEGYLLVSSSYDAATHTQTSQLPSYIVPAPPTRSLQFIREQGLLDSTKLGTILKTLDWSRRLHHFIGAPSTAVFEQIWHYRGVAPVSRVMDATVSPDSPDAYHYTAGCHGTSGFLHSVLRTLNIPVDNNVIEGHSVTRFMTESLYLSHGDDPYMAYDGYGVPLSALLIPESTFRSWFVDVPSALAYENIGRNGAESMIQHLSGMLQITYCSDPVPNADHAHSLLLTSNNFSLHPSTYNVNYFENLPTDPSNPSLPPSLWDRLAQKVARNGGCDATRSALRLQYEACMSIVPVSERPADCQVPL
jgi:hypothetical protein